MLTVEESKLHEAVLKCAGYIARGQNHLIRLLLRVERTRFYRKINRRNLHEYIQLEIGIDSTYTHELSRVVEKALEFPVLAQALDACKMGSSHASKIVSKINAENAAELVEFASTHTLREVGDFIANREPEKRTRENIKQISANQFKISMVMSKEEYEILRRVQDGEAQRQKPAKMKDAVMAGLHDYLERRDKFKKAERAAKRSGTKKSAGPKKVTLQNVRTFKRVPFTAAQKHEVYLKSGVRCSFQDHRGRCEARRHLHIHHEIPVKDGGSNDPANLVMLCSYHHDFVHQISFPGMALEYSFAGVARGTS